MTSAQVRTSLPYASWKSTRRFPLWSINSSELLLEAKSLKMPDRVMLVKFSSTKLGTIWILIRLNDPSTCELEEAEKVVSPGTRAARRTHEPSSSSCCWELRRMLARLEHCEACEGFRRRKETTVLLAEPCRLLSRPFRRDDLGARPELVGEGKVGREGVGRGLCKLDVADGDVGRQLVLLGLQGDGDQVQRPEGIGGIREGLDAPGRHLAPRLTLSHRQVLAREDIRRSEEEGRGLQGAQILQVEGHDSKGQPQRHLPALLIVLRLKSENLCIFVVQSNSPDSARAVRAVSNHQLERDWGVDVDEGKEGDGEAFPAGEHLGIKLLHLPGGNVRVDLHPPIDQDVLNDSAALPNDVVRRALQGSWRKARPTVLLLQHEERALVAVGPGHIVLVVGEVHPHVLVRVPQRVVKLDRHVGADPLARGNRDGHEVQVGVPCRIPKNSRAGARQDLHLPLARAVVPLRALGLPQPHGLISSCYEPQLVGEGAAGSAPWPSGEEGIVCCHVGLGHAAGVVPAAEDEGEGARGCGEGGPVAGAGS
eukprot:768672-Hanusia_phi.AAC.8